MYAGEELKLLGAVGALARHMNYVETYDEGYDESVDEVEKRDG